MATKWTEKDQAAALKEGWGIFDSGLRGIEIQKNDEKSVFGNDRAAAMHVARRESFGSKWHGKALRVIGEAQVKTRPSNKRRPKDPLPRVLITVEGGLIQDVSTDVPVEVLVYDWDNIKDDPECGRNEPAGVIGKKRFAALEAEQEAEVKRIHDRLIAHTQEGERAL